MTLLRTPAPNRVELENGGYLLFDFHEGKYRIALYLRRVSKSETLVNALSRALNRPIYDKKIKEIATYIESCNRFENLKID
jgi:hypothetical protein